MAEGLEDAKRVIGEIVDFQREFAEQVGDHARASFPLDADFEEDLTSAINAFAEGRIDEALHDRRQDRAQRQPRHAEGRSSTRI